MSSVCLLVPITREQCIMGAQRTLIQLQVKHSPHYNVYFWHELVVHTNIGNLYRLMACYTYTLPTGSLGNLFSHSSKIKERRKGEEGDDAAVCKGSKPYIPD